MNTYQTGDILRYGTESDGDRRSVLFNFYNYNLMCKIKKRLKL